MMRPMRVRTAVGILVASLLVLSGCTDSDDSKKGTPPPAAATLTGDARLAHDLAMGLANSVTGKVTSAAYVVGTYRTWQGNPGRIGLPTTRQILPTDKVFVVKIFGDFISHHSRPARASVNRDGQAILVYNATQHRGVMTGFGSGRSPEGSAVEDTQLVALGAPHVIAYSKSD